VEGAHELESACLIPIPKGKEPTPHARCGHLPHCTLRHRGRLLPLPSVEKATPDPETSLSESEILTLAIFARFSRFASDRDFYRYAKSNLRGAFPTLPERSQFNRCVRSHARLLEEVTLYLVRMMKAQRCHYEALWTPRRCRSGTLREEARDGSGRLR
jgi:hypothetical protein